MAKASPDLSVRQHERFSCDLPAEITIAPACAGQVRPMGVAQSAVGVIPGRLTDASKGGIGLRTGVYLPKHCRIAVRVADPERAGEAVLVGTLVVQRTAMLDRAPTYYVGAAFEGTGGGEQPLLARLKRAGGSAC